MIASLTITYGDERFEVFKYKHKDFIDKFFRSSLDLNLLLFHNSPPQFVERVKNSHLLDGFNFSFAAADGTYPQVLKSALEFLKNKGVQKIVFLQDDVFSICTLDTIKALVSFLKSTSLSYLNLEMNCEAELKPRNIIERTDSFNVYDTDTKYFRTSDVVKDCWPFDDSPYFATLDFVMNKIYDETYYSLSDIWIGEHYLRNKFFEINIPRYTSNIQFFRRVNFIGKNTHNRDNELKFLNERFV